MKLTQQRQEIFDALTRHSPLTNARLGDLLEDRLDRATVYRNLELFERIGIVKRVWIGWKSQVELSEEFVPHHHHAVCKHCGSHIPIESPELESLIKKFSAELNFRLEDHTLDIIGYCAACK